MKLKRAFLIFALLTLAASSLSAQSVTPVPPLINFQGRLAKPDGTPVPDAMHTFSFTLWDAPTGGKQKWSQYQDYLQTHNGVFATILGKGDQLTSDILNGATYIQIQVDSDPPLPRQQLLSVAYALIANTVPDGAITAAKIANGTITADKLASGIGLSLPFIGSTNENADAFVVTNTSNGSAIAGNASTRFGVYGYSNSNYGGYFFSNTGRGLYTNGLQSDGVNYFNGNVGIGTANPSRLLDLIANSSSGGPMELVMRDLAAPVDNRIWRFRVPSNGTFSLEAMNETLNSGTAAMTALRNGNVGIGTTTPATKFEVNGVAQVHAINIIGGSDVAEPYKISPVGKTVPLPGMVVALDAVHVGQMRVAAAAYDRTVGGIISGANGINPGITLTQRGTIADGSLPVASVGRVWCWCDADANGPIVVGDLLTTSHTPGHAMRVTDYNRANGATIGKAMSPLKKGKGLVLVLVSLK